ncbi:iron-sulfur cluster carrier protein ApbC [candidate division KSB1 bacterium]
MTEEAVLNALRTIEDPDLHRDIVSLGFVKDIAIDGNNLSVTIELTTPACPVKDRLKTEAETALKALDGVHNLTVNMTARVRATKSELKDQMLPRVKNIIPIASGKGGVGKSTVSANIALALQKSGAKVGIMDADIYGPSIPLILGTKDLPQQRGSVILPVNQYGLKVISMGFFIQQNQAVVWRGPMLSKMVEQFLGGVDWGELDYLIIDLPPGTGDIQLTLCQSVPLTGSVIVSTPQDVAFNVARKAILMFNQLKSPVLGLIENMSHFICSNCGHEDHIFGSGGSEKASKDFNIPLLGSIPLATVIRKTSDEGRPVVVSNPDSAEAQEFIKVAEQLAAQVSINNMKAAEEEIKVTF